MSDEPAMVAVDVGPVRAQPAGVGLYAANLARELAAQHEMTVGLIGVRPEAALLSDHEHEVPHTAFRTPTYHSWLQLCAQADAGRLGAGLVHFTNAAAPVFGALPYVVTVHDLSVARMPLTHPVARWGVLPFNILAIARARNVIVPSRWTARELARIGVDGRRIVVIPHAPTLKAPAAPTTADAALERLGLTPDGYLLYFGTLEPRKNIGRLVAAFERVSAGRPDLQLVLAGAPGWRFGGIEQRVAASPARDRIVMAGYVNDEDLAALILGSAAVAYVSLYEGFGMPVLDALALGASVVTSRTTAMPEAAGGAAVLVNPRDVGQIARGIESALANHDAVGGLRGALVARTWADVTAEHIDVYRHVMQRL